MIVADTSVWIDFSWGRATPATMRLAEFLRSKDVLVGDLILCELLQGSSSEREANALELRLWRDCELVTMSDPTLAAEAAANRRILRSKGFTVRKTIDLLIGTFCIRHKHTLLHSDRDYEPMERFLGLQVVPTHYMVNEPRLAYG